MISLICACAVRYSDNQQSSSFSLFMANDPSSYALMSIYQHCSQPELASAAIDWWLLWLRAVSTVPHRASILHFRIISFFWMTLLFLTMTKASLSEFWDALHPWMRTKSCFCSLTRMLEIHFKNRRSSFWMSMMFPLQKPAVTDSIRRCWTWLAGYEHHAQRQYFAWLCCYYRVPEELQKKASLRTNNFVSDTIFLPGWANPLVLHRPM